MAHLWWSQLLGELVAVLVAGDEAHVVVVVDHPEAGVAGRLRPVVADVVQLGGVVDLVEPVDDGLVAHGHVPLDHLVEHHVLHPVLAEVGHDVLADPALQRRRRVGPGQVHPHPAAPLVDGDLRAAQPLQVLGVEVDPLGHALHLAGEVVRPAVVRALELLGPAPRQLGDERRAAVHAHVVERGERAVGLAGDDDRLAVALEADPVARAGRPAPTGRRGSRWR